MYTYDFSCLVRALLETSGRASFSLARLLVPSLIRVPTVVVAGCFGVYAWVVLRRSMNGCVGWWYLSGLHVVPRRRGAFLRTAFFRIYRL